MKFDMTFDTGQQTLAPPAPSKARRRPAGRLLSSALLIFAASLTAKGAELSPETLTAWEAYVHAQNARVAEYSNTTPFLWSDQAPARLQHLHKGEMVVAPFGEN